MLKKIITGLICASMLLSSAVMPAGAEAKNTYTDYNQEIMNRGLVAVKTSGGIYLSWRLNPDEDAVLGTADGNIAFDIYRDNKVIAREVNTTNYVDADGSESSVYAVQPVDTDGNGGNISESVSALSSGSNYFDIPLDKPARFSDGNRSYSYSAGDASVGDVDGDGEYEIIVKWDANAQDNSNSGVTGNVLLDAYELTPDSNGNHFKWRIDLGRNIRAGAHYTQFLVYDFDGDGKAELACKTAPGSKDGEGNYVTAASSVSAIKSADNTAVYVNDSGFVIEGDEYYTVFDGATGAALDTIYYPVNRYPTNAWGKSSDNTNRVDRFLGGVAYLDGITPSIISVRGYYGRTTVSAMNFEGGKITTIGIADTNKLGKQFEGQGNHNLAVADVDSDGKDEILLGSICFDDDLTVLWSSGRGHGDAMHIADYDPTHPGYEFFSVHESGGYPITGSTTASQGKIADYGMTVYDAATGEELLHSGASGDTGRGIMANTGAGGYYQFWGAGAYKAMGNNNFEATSYGASSNFRIFWDGDLYDELLDGTSIAYSDNDFDARQFGCTKINGSKSNPAVSADILGDWREEVVYPLTDSSALRVFTTNIKTTFKMKTLMTDRVYRSGVAAEQTAYNQPPHIGYYMDTETFKGAPDSIQIKSKPTKTEYYVGEEFSTEGMVVNAIYADGTVSTLMNFDIEGFDSMNTGTHTVTVSYKGKTATLTVKVVSGFAINKNGMITSWKYNGESTVTVPETIDGVEVAGFAKGALTNTAMKKLYIYDIGLVFENGNIFEEELTVYGYTGSTLEKYAKKYPVNWVALDEPIDEVITYEEDFYKDYSNAQMLMQTTSAGTINNNFITYNTASLPSGGYIPSDTMGFEIVQKSNLTQYLKICSGLYDSRYMNSNQVYITTNESYPSKDVISAVLAMDICFPADDNAPYIEFQDGENVIDKIDAATLEAAVKASGSNYITGGWYKYSLSYADGVYTKKITKGNGDIITEEALDTATGENFVNTIVFKQGIPSTGTSTTTRTGMIYIDNLSLNLIPSSDIEFKVTGTDGKAINDAVVKVAGNEYKTAVNGTAAVKLEKGLYSVSISMPGYVSQVITAEAFNSGKIEIVLEKKANTVVESGAEITQTESLDKNYNVTITKSENSAKAEITSESEIKDMMLITAVYDENGVLVSVSLTEVSGADGEYSAEAEYEDGFYTKVMLWKNYMPVIEAQ